MVIATPRMKRTQTRWTTTLAALASVALATSAFAQDTPPAQAAPAVSQELAKQHLTAARNTLSEVTQLPAAAQLTGNARTQVQQLISNFNELITKESDWRESYAKVEANLAALLDSDAPAPPSGTAGAVGTSGTTPATALDPAIRAKLVEFRAALDRFEAVVETPAAPPAPSAPTSPEPAVAPPTAATPAPAAAAPDTKVVIDDRPDAPGPERTTDDAQPVTVVAKELLNHVEAVEVILGAQTAAQKTATAAAGGAMTQTATPSGSTKTTLAGPNVTLNAEQLDMIKMHLKELRRLLEQK